MDFKKYETRDRRRSALNEYRRKHAAVLNGLNTLAHNGKIEDAVKILETLPFPAGNGLVIVGAEYRMGRPYFAKDFAERDFRLFMTELSPETVRLIQEAAPGALSYRNPVYTGDSGEACAAVIEILLNRREAGILVCQDCFSLPGIDSARAGSLAEKILRSGTPVIFFGSAGGSVSDSFPKNLVVYPTLSLALYAAQFLVEFRNNFEIKMLQSILGSAVSNS
jgi:acyl-CoA synthetase (NDP forming)